MCETYKGLNPLELLDYPAEDVFNLIYGQIDYNRLNYKTGANPARKGMIRRPAGDNWF